MLADSAFDYHNEVRSGRIVGAASPTGNTFETFVYRVENPDNPTQGVWFPCPPHEAVVAFTAIGFPVTTTDVAHGDPRSMLSVRSHPNPTHWGCSIDLSLPTAGVVRLSVIDVQGRQVAALANGEYGAGSHQFRWDGHSARGELGPGVYFLQAFFNGRTAIHRFILLGRAR